MSLKVRTKVANIITRLFNKKLVQVARDTVRILVACGAADGISATFNAPIVGVFLLLR